MYIIFIIGLLKVRSKCAKCIYSNLLVLLESNPKYDNPIIKFKLQLKISKEKLESNQPNIMIQVYEGERFYEPFKKRNVVIVDIKGTNIWVVWDKDDILGK